MDYKIIQGDCLEVMRGMENNSIDCVVTDPPYGHNNNNGDLISRREAALGRGEYNPQKNNRPILNDGPEANDLFRNALTEFQRLLKPGCCCCCCGGGGGPDPQFARWSLWLDEAIGFKQMIVWDKGPMGLGWHYRRSYEVVLVGQKKGAACKWYDTTRKIENIIRADKNIRKIIPRKNQHPTKKPSELAAFFIGLHSQENDLILDPFCGSGSTGIACQKMGRKFIGIELNPKYCELARKRIAEDQPLFSAAER